MNTPVTDTKLPRFFWRRLAAFLIDSILFYLVAIALVISLATIVPWAPRFFISAKTECQPAGPSALADRIDREWRLAPGQSRENQVCASYIWGIPEGRAFRSTLIDAGIQPSQRSIRLAIDETGNPLEFTYMQVGRGVLDQIVPLLLFALCSAALIARFGTTPGKRLFALRVVQGNGSLLPFASAAKRETLRMLPSIVLAVLGTPLLLLFLAIFGTGDILADAIEAVTVFGAPVQVILLASFVVFTLFGLMWWVFPFMRWRGQTIYDRLAGCHVIRRSVQRMTTSPAALAS